MMKRFLSAVLFVFMCIFNTSVLHAANNCTGATYYDSDSDTCIACPTGYDYNTDAGKTSITQCQIHCDAGTYVGTGVIVGYTQLEYIESNGTQYISTNLSSPGSYVHGKVGVVPVANPKNAVVIYFPGGTLAINRSKFYLWSNAASSSLDYSTNASLGSYYDIDYVVTPTNRVLTVNGTSVSDNTATNLPTGSVSFGANGYQFTGRIYYYKQFDANNNLIMDIIPVRRDSDGAVGMYDKVSGTFFTNSGTGTFIAGSDVGPIYGQCINVGTGYYAAASTVNFGSLGTRSACPTGTYSTVTNATSVSACQQCTGATYNDETGMAACKSCPSGYDYNTTSGKTSVTQCQIHCDAGTWNGEYTQLEYIESTGTQYIDTGISQNTSLTSIEHYAGFGYSQLPTTRQLTGFNGSVNNYWGVYPANGKVVFEVYTKGTYSISPNVMYDIYVKQTASNISLQVNLNDNQVESIVSGSSSFNTSSLRIFDLNGYNSSFRMNHARFSYYLVYVDGVLVRDFVPVRRNSDGAIGMYDRVTNAFFPNSGTGTFVAGADVAGLMCTDVGAGYYAAASTVNFGSLGTRSACPAGTYSNITNAASCTSCTGATYSDTTAATSCIACPTGYDYNTDAGKTSITQCQIHCDAGTWNGEYTQLEYIESTGTQYIDSGFKPNQDTHVVMEYMMHSVEAGIFGARNGKNNKAFMILYPREPRNLRSDYGNAEVSGPSLSSSFYDTLITVDKNRNVTTFYNSSNSVLATISNAEATFQVDYDLVFPGDNTADTISYAEARVYYVQIYDNGVLVRDMVPVRRDSDGAIGMYDKVSGTFFTNSGTGTFIAGSDVGPIYGQCINVGAGYYAGASTVNYGSVGTRTACPVGLTTVGYGRGADSANDCGRKLHVGDSVVYMRQNKETTPSLNFQMPNGDRFYVSLSPSNHTMSKLHFWYNNAGYTAYDDSLFYGERNFETGVPITQ